MTIKIEEPIAGYEVVKPGPAAQAQASAEQAESAPQPRADVIRMHEKLERPDRLVGSTYKVKTPISDHAMYITINDILLNEGTDFEARRPFEIFINSKNLDHYQWVVGLTRVISAVFRKGGDVAFLVDELKAVFDPRGGYWKPGGKFMPSVIAEIGEVIERHLVEIGILAEPEMDERQKRYLAGKREEYEESKKQQDAFAEDQFPAGAQLCMKCNTAAVVMMDGCLTCLNCGDSKCG